jgi:hypothetical protein
LKVGKAKSEDVMENGKNRRAQTSARKARQHGFPNAEARVIRDLGETTTGKAKAVEAKRVRTLRNQGHDLPLNKEKARAYQANSRPRKTGGC